MEKYIFMLLFIAPGFLSRYLVDSFLDKENIKGDFEKTLISLLYGLPISIITIIICYIKLNIRNINELKNHLINFKFMIVYFIVSLISMIIFTSILILCNRYVFVKINNKIRGILRLPQISNNENGWKEFFGKKNNDRIISIEKDRIEIAKGMLKHNTTNNVDKSEIILEKCDLVKALQDNLLESDVYIDLENGIVIREYDLKEDE